MGKEGGSIYRALESSSQCGSFKGLYPSPIVLKLSLMTSLVVYSSGRNCASICYWGHRKGAVHSICVSPREGILAAHGKEAISVKLRSLWEVRARGQSGRCSMGLWARSSFLQGFSCLPLILFRMFSSLCRGILSLDL